jgi:hypothetical protein
VTNTIRVSGSAAGGHSKRVTSVPSGGDSRRVGDIVYGRDSYLMTSGDHGVMPVSLSGDMGFTESYLLLSGDQYETNPDRDLRVING